MANPEGTIDQAKVEAAFSKLRANPQMAGTVKQAFDELFVKINIDLNSHEQLALAKWMFGGGSDPQFTGVRDEVSYSTCPVTVSTCPPSFTADICHHCPAPPPPSNTGRKCAIICF